MIIVPFLVAPHKAYGNSLESMLAVNVEATLKALLQFRKN